MKNRLLITTQKLDVNDAVLGFFHRWVEEFSKHFESVVVICLEEGEHHLPDNVRVLSLGKESGRSRVKYIRKFYSYIWRERNAYDAVFVHMNPEYVVLGGMPWRIMKKKIALWYTHRAVTPLLRIVVVFANIIATSTKESFRLKSKKVHYLGHGIDTSRFIIRDAPFTSPLEILHVGRITPVKRIEVILGAVRLLRDSGLDIVLRLVGAPVKKSDIEYQGMLKDKSKTLGIEAAVEWAGEVSNREIAREYERASIIINAAPEGGMDKVVLEALAAGRAVFATNRAFEGVFGSYWTIFSYPEGDSSTLAERIQAFFGLPTEEQIWMLHQLEEKVKKEYDTAIIIDKISNLLNVAGN